MDCLYILSAITYEPIINSNLKNPKCTIIVKQNEPFLEKCSAGSLTL